MVVVVKEQEQEGGREGYVAETRALHAHRERRALLNCQWRQPGDLDAAVARKRGTRVGIR